MIPAYCKYDHSTPLGAEKGARTRGQPLRLFVPRRAVDGRRGRESALVRQGLLHWRREERPDLLLWARRQGQARRHARIRLRAVHVWARRRAHHAEGSAPKAVLHAALCDRRRSNHARAVHPEGQRPVRPNRLKRLTRPAPRRPQKRRGARINLTSLPSALVQPPHEPRVPPAIHPPPRLLQRPRAPPVDKQQPPDRNHARHASHAMAHAQIKKMKCPFDLQDMPIQHFAHDPQVSADSAPKVLLLHVLGVQQEIHPPARPETA